MAGIYLIHNTRTDDRYIGGTTTGFAARFRSHRSALKGGYGVPLLQRAWDAEGDPEHWFRFIPLHECAPEDVRRLEIEAIETLRPSLNVIIALTAIDRAVRVTGLTREGVKARMRAGKPLDAPKGLRDVIDGVSLTLRQIAVQFGLPERLVRERYARGERHPRLTRPPGVRT